MVGVTKLTATMPPCMFVSCVHARPECEPSPERDFTQLFFPGAVVPLRKLVELNVTVDDLQQLHIQAVLMCVRGDNFEKLTVPLLRKLDANYDLLQLLFGPWADQLTPAICEYIELNADALLAFGIHRQHVRQLAWPLTRWVALFGIDSSFMSALKLQHLEDYFPNLHRDVRKLAKTHKKSSPLFEIDL
jgi:hypothetical protein